MGTSEMGEIAYQARIVEPDISLITTVSESHLEGIGSRDDVFDEKSSIIPATRKDGTVIVNLDDDYSQRAIAAAGAMRVITYGFSPGADVGCKYEVTDTGSNVHAYTADGEVSYFLNAPGKHNVANSLAAIAISYALGINKASIISGLQKFTGAKGRLQSKNLGGGIRLLDDTYNANPASSIAALDVLSESDSRKIFVFGGMAELGKEEYELHKKVGVKAAACDVDVLYVCGDESIPTYDAFNGEKYRFRSIDELNQALRTDIVGGDTVLVKGSRRFQLDRVSRFLEEEFV